VKKKAGFYGIVGGAKPKQATALEPRLTIHPTSRFRGNDYSFQLPLTPFLTPRAGFT